MNAILPMLRDTELTALVAPPGVRSSSHRLRTEIEFAIRAAGGQDDFGFVDNAFLYRGAGGDRFCPTSIGANNVSDAADPPPHLNMLDDGLRIELYENDRLGYDDRIPALPGRGQ